MMTNYAPRVLVTAINPPTLIVYYDEVVGGSVHRHKKTIRIRKLTSTMVRPIASACARKTFTCACASSNAQPCTLCVKTAVLFSKHVEMLYCTGAKCIECKAALAPHWEYELCASNAA